MCVCGGGAAIQYTLDNIISPFLKASRGPSLCVCWQGSAVLHNNTTAAKEQEEQPAARWDIRWLLLFVGKLSHVPVTRKQVISAPEQANNPVSKWGDGHSAHTPPVWSRLREHCTAGMRPSYADDRATCHGCSVKINQGTDEYKQWISEKKGSSRQKGLFFFTTESPPAVKLRLLGTRLTPKPVSRAQSLVRHKKGHYYAHKVDEQIFVIHIGGADCVKALIMWPLVPCGHQVKPSGRGG